MKKLLTLEIWKASIDPLNGDRKIRIKFLNRWTLVTWTYHAETELIT